MGNVITKQSYKERQLIIYQEKVMFLQQKGWLSPIIQKQNTSDYQNLTDVEKEIIIEANSILKDLKSKSVKLALVWCKQNQSKLKQRQSTFQSNLVFQEYIENLKEDQWKALEYIRNFTNLLQQEWREKAFGCMLLAKQTKKPSNYQIYFEDQQWEQLIRQFKIELYEVYCYPMESPLLGAIKCGISTLKTQYCDQLKAIRCPICTTEMQELSKELLTTQKLGSTWICRISGELMDENNPPMMLPNHQVYSQKALQQMSDQMKEEVYCPITKEKFKFNQCIRVYLT
ncbi:hypothetical protein FGO68_gene15013 [Halteria grandinella]|uniref:RING-Gid-type domain-containing protein n=1 Tax=Halteria grandinella TaxID=5974 RepID=A0A8J8NI51_HALGN|nr:hypothetical protein FGO68_gene15013 [Halteria grandinella]